MIPARHASSRFPGKPLTPLTGSTGIAKPLIQRSWETARAIDGVRLVVIATDDERIADAARRFGAHVVMTPTTCTNGSERCSAALAMLSRDIDIVVNLQGDAPLTPPEAVPALIEALRDPTVAVATPAMPVSPAVYRRLLDDQRAGRVGGTTVVCNAAGDALYFSKALLPYVPAERQNDENLPVRLHLGVYAYRRTALLRYADLAPCALELFEGLEQLRFLDAGIPVRVVDIALQEDVWELNNPADVEPIETALRARGVA